MNQDELDTCPQCYSKGEWGPPDEKGREHCHGDHAFRGCTAYRFRRGDKYGYVAGEVGSIFNEFLIFREIKFGEPETDQPASV